HRRGELTHEAELELWLGPSHRGSTFSSREELHQAWFKNRDRLMTAWAKHGKRPAGWWEFESPIPRPRYGTEQSVLYEAGLLSDAERAELEAWWREQFTRAQTADFWICLVRAPFLKGEAARREHYRWMDLPASLRRKWTAEHRRRASTIQKLETSTKETVGEDASGL